MKQEVTVKTGTPIDFKNVKPPKFKINEQAYLLYFGEVIKVDIVSIDLSLRWFDNAYTSRYEWEVKYDLGAVDRTTPWYHTQFEENMLYKKLAEVKLAEKEFALKRFVERKNTLENNIRITKKTLDSYEKQYQDLLK